MYLVMERGHASLDSLLKQLKREGLGSVPLLVRVVVWTALVVSL